MGNSKSTSSVSSHSSLLTGQTGQRCQGMSGAENRLWQGRKLPETGKLDLALPSAMGLEVGVSAAGICEEEFQGKQKCWFREETGSDLLILFLTMRVTP